MPKALLNLNDYEHVAIWREVKNGRGNHGDFLRSFAEAVVRADHENLNYLRCSSVFLIEKYGLLSYLEAPDAK